MNTFLKFVAACLIALTIFGLFEYNKPEHWDYRCGLEGVVSHVTYIHDGERYVTEVEFEPGVVEIAEGLHEVNVGDTLCKQWVKQHKIDGRIELSHFRI